MHAQATDESSGAWAGKRSSQTCGRESPRLEGTWHRAPEGQLGTQVPEGPQAESTSTSLEAARLSERW